MTNSTRITFEGYPNLRPQDPHRDSPKRPEPYIVSPELKKAVNLAIYLRRPLLIEGDAGCGKTRLASAVAYELGLPLYRWDVRSNTKAQDGLYEYDAILRLHDVEVQKVKKTAKPKGQSQISLDQGGAPDQDLKEPKLRDPANPKDYRTLGALGKAFSVRDRPAVVLIDEIDKADLDFPNDLLGVLDDPWEFFIRETGETVAAHPDFKPIVIITSNKEKGNLPAPFLRRCLYRYVDFPSDPKQLQEIVERHYQIREIVPPPSLLIEEAITKFLSERKDRKWFKQPGTSEFLDWLKALHEFESAPYDPTQLKQDKIPPYPEILFKRQDYWRNLFKAS